MDNSTLPLAGVKVVDFTRVLSGPFCTALLGDLGAEIIKIEPPQGDDYRAIAPMRNEQSALFTVMNRNKKSLVLDLKKPEAVALAQELASQADIVVENFRPGVANKLGIGYDSLKALNPRLIYVSVSGFGQDGPAAHMPAYDIVIQAMSGLMNATGHADGPPTLVGEAVSDVISGLFASWGALAALYGRERTGTGTHVDVSMFESTLAFAATSTSRYLFTGEDAPRVGNRHPLSAPFGAYQAKDGHFVLAILNNKLFAQLANALETPAFATDTRFASDALRSGNEPALRAWIEDWASTRTVSEVLAVLEQAGLPCAPIWNTSQALSSEQTKARGFLREVEDPRLENLKLPSQPVRFTSYGENQVNRAPGLGEHTELIAASVGLSAQRIAELRELGVFG